MMLVTVGFVLATSPNAIIRRQGREGLWLDRAVVGHVGNSLAGIVGGQMAAHPALVNTPPAVSFRSAVR